MSTYDSNSQYSFDFSTVAANGTNNQFGFMFLSRGDMDDAMAFALVAAVQALDWPSTTTFSGAVTKMDATFTSYTTNPTATPPSFT